MQHVFYTLFESFTTGLSSNCHSGGWLNTTSFTGCLSFLGSLPCSLTGILCIRTPHVRIYLLESPNKDKLPSKSTQSDREMSLEENRIGRHRGKMRGEGMEEEKRRVEERGVEGGEGEGREEEERSNGECNYVGQVYAKKRGVLFLC